jgi:hypothetical protein
MVLRLKYLLEATPAARPRRLVVGHLILNQGTRVQFSPGSQMKPYSKAYDSNKMKKESWKGAPCVSRNRSYKKAMRRKAKKQMQQEVEINGPIV